MALYSEHSLREASSAYLLSLKSPIKGHIKYIRDWLEALEKGLNREFPEGVRGYELKLMSDNGSQPTSLSFMKACSNLEVEQVFTSYNTQKEMRIQRECYLL